MINTKAEGVYYTPLVWSSASVLIVSAVLLAILMVSAVVGAFRFRDPLVTNGTAPFGLWLRGGVGDLASPESMKRLIAWRGVAPVDIAFHESRTLAGLTQERVGVIAIPDARSLSLAEAAQLREFLMDGGGVVLTGSIGVVDGEGGWRGYDLMQTLLEVDSIVPLPVGASAFAVIARRGPLAADLEPEERLDLIAEPGVPAIANPNSELRWHWLANAETEFASPEVEVGPGLELDASKRLEVGRGRLVWLGMGPESAAQSGSERWRAMVRLVRSAAKWAGHQCQIEVLRWPRGARFAVVVRGSFAPVSEGGAEAGAAPGVREGESDVIGRPRNGETLNVETLAGETLAGHVEALIRRAEDSGGLAELPIPSSASPSSHAIARPERLAKRGAWVTQPGALRAWREVRDAVSASVERVGSERLLVAVSNRASSPAGEVALRIHLGRRVARVELQGTIVGQVLPTARFSPGNAYLDVVLDELKGRQNQAFTVDFKELPEGWNS